MGGLPSSTTHTAHRDMASTTCFQLSDGEDPAYYQSLTMADEHLFSQAQFSHLVILDISNNHLTKFPNQLQELRYLRALDCSDNQIQQVDSLLMNQLQVLVMFNNQLARIPTIKAPLSCLHIGQNRITNLSFNTFQYLLQLQLVVFLYFENPFCAFNRINLMPNNSTYKFLRRLETTRQKHLIELFYDQDKALDCACPEMHQVIQWHNRRKINYSILKLLEETVFETYFMYEFIQQQS